MSATLERPIKPASGKELTPEQVAWNLRVFSKLGWQSKKPAQQKLQTEMKAACAAVDKSVLQPDVGPNCASQLAQEKLKAGKEFKAFQLALAYYEKASPDARVGMADQLRAAAQAYNDHWAKHSKREKAHAETQRKKSVCDAALADLRKLEVVRQVRQLGDPPWNSDVAMKAASLKATLDFETLPDSQAEVVGGVHAFPAFWVNSAKPAQQGGAPNAPPEAQKSFLFKPMAARSGAPGFPPGGDTAREAITGRMGDLLAGMTGIDFGVPETHVVAVGRDKLPADQLGADKVAGVANPNAPLVGSIQQFAKADGGARDQPMADLARVPPKACQKIMILDMLSLNMDRHGDNVMVQTKPGQAPDLVPIDHGLTFPPPESLEEMPKKLGAAFNVMLLMPGSHEPFTAEMLKAIDDIDPDTMAAGLRRELALVEKQHPETKNKLSRDAIDMGRRSALFLKMGAAWNPALSAATIQLALGQYGDELLDPTVSDDDFADRAAEVLADLAGQQGAIKELFTMPLTQQADMKVKLVENGWLDSFKVEGWINKNPKLALAVYKADTKEPSKLRELVATIGRDAVTDKLKTMKFSALYDKRNDFALSAPSTTITRQVTADAAELARAFPGEYVDDGDPRNVLSRAAKWRELEALGGVDALPAACAAIKASKSLQASSRTLVADCKKVLAAAAGMPVAASAVGRMRDLDIRAVRIGIAYLDDFAAELPQGSPVSGKITVFKRAPIDGSPAQRDSLRILQVEALDAVRADIGPRLDVIGKRVETRMQDAVDDDTRDTLVNKLNRLGMDRVSVMSGHIKGAQAMAARYEREYPS